jgi:hypothetical protein
MIGKQTSLDLNGPILSFTTQPQSVGVCDSGSATFVGIATAFFPTQDPPNPASNTGTLLYQWYAEGFGPLTDGTFQGATITGSGTTTLTITNAKSPTANGLGFYVDVDYVPSAYSQPVGSAVTVGTGRSTGNAVNEVLNSNSATLTVFPVLSVATQPTDQTAASTRSAIFTTLGALTDTTQGNISYRWQLNGNDLSDSTTVIGSGTTSLSVSLPLIPIDTQVTHFTNVSLTWSPGSIISNITATDVPLYRSYIIDFNTSVSSATIVTFLKQGAGEGAAFPTLEVQEFTRLSSTRYRLRFGGQVPGFFAYSFCRGFTIQATPDTSNNTVRARLSHPTSCNSPIFTNTVNFNIVNAREIINFESVNDSGGFIGSGSINLFDNPTTFTADLNNLERSLVIYPSEKNIRVRITLAAAAGASRGSRGGAGGLSVFEYVLRQNIEYVFKLGAATAPTGGSNGGGGAAYLYEKARLIAVCGGGGGSGTSGRGGDGGGIGVGGEFGQGRNSGAGGRRVDNGALPTGSGSLASGSSGGQVSGCTIGRYYRNIGFSPCQDVGQQQWRAAKDGTITRQTAVIQRGYKQGLGYRNNGGNGSGNQGGGGSGAYGGNAATADGSGGGGGSGYTDGSVNVINTQLGGNSSTNAYAKIEAIV